MQALSNIKAYFSNKCLFKNTRKSNYVSFSSKQAKFKLESKIFMGEKILVQTQITEFIDENLSWREFVSSVVDKISHDKFALKQIAHFLLELPWGDPLGMENPLAGLLRSKVNKSFG